jgi:arabinofuranosyltransferase
MRRELLLLLLIIGLLCGHMASYGLCVQDDAYISFRYADNLVQGHGLVYNPGEHVEGYTNFLWTLLIAAAMAAGASPLWASVVGGVLSTVALAVGAWALAVALLPAEQRPLALLAAAFVALDAGITLEGMQGLETSFYAALLCVGLALSVRDRQLGAAGLFALAALTRPEGVMVFGVIELVRLARRRRIDRTTALSWALVGGVVLGHLCFRLAYYGQPLPNTFYAKVGTESAQVLRGVRYLLAFGYYHVVLIALAAIGAATVARRPRLGAGAPAVAVVVAYSLYVAAVGGDFKETFRFIVPIFGPLAALAAAAVGRLAGGRLLLGGLLAFATAAAVDASRQVPMSVDAAAYRRADMSQRLLVGRWLAATADPDTVLAIHSAGTIPYASRLVTIDMWGLTDPNIARREISDMGSGTAGHEKTDYAYTFSRQPDLYLPEDGLLTAEPVRLPIPVDFPADFEDRYAQQSVQLAEGAWVNLFRRQ